MEKHDNEQRVAGHWPFALVCLGMAVCLTGLVAARLAGGTLRDLVAGLSLLGLPIALLVLAAWLWPQVRRD